MRSLGEAEVALDHQRLRRRGQQCGAGGHLGQRCLGDGIRAEGGHPSEISGSGRLAACKTSSIDGHWEDICAVPPGSNA